MGYLTRTVRYGLAFTGLTALAGCGIDEVGFCEDITEQLIVAEDRFEIIEVTDASNAEPPTVYVRYRTRNNAGFEKDGMVTCTYDAEATEATRIVVDGKPLDDDALAVANRSFK